MCARLDEDWKHCCRVLGCVTYVCLPGGARRPCSSSCHSCCSLLACSRSINCTLVNQTLVRPGKTNRFFFSFFDLNYVVTYDSWYMAFKYAGIFQKKAENVQNYCWNRQKRCIDSLSQKIGILEASLGGFILSSFQCAILEMWRVKFNEDYVHGHELLQKFKVAFQKLPVFVSYEFNFRIAGQH